MGLAFVREAEAMSDGLKSHEHDLDPTLVGEKR